MNPDCDVNYLLNAAIENCDCRKLIHSFNLNELNEKHLDHVYKKLGEYFFVENLNSNDLAQDGSEISNVLQVLWELIGDLNINNEILSLNLAKGVLLVITDEYCSVKNMKTALHIFNATITKPNVVKDIVKDDTLEGLLQILGRKVSSVGDYECQAAFIEALCRIASQENRLCWINIWFPEPTARSMFRSINPEKFECSLRQLLNYINRNEPERRVFSFIAQSVSFGSVQLKKPKECDMWIDFNYDSQSISFYCSECSLQCLENSSEYPEMWETIVIDYSSLAGFFIKERKAEKKIEVVLLLNSPCYTLSTLSNATNPEFHKNRVTIVFWDLLDIYPHLEAIYGKDKHMTQLSAEKTTKLSPSADVDNITNERRDVLSNDFSSQRKVSNLTSPICIDVCENEVLSNEFPSQRKVSNLASPICIDACQNEVLSNEFPSQRKVSNLTSPICIDACENVDFFPDSDVNQTFSVFRKVSESTEKIHFTSEDVKNQGIRKISESSELIQVDISVANESNDENQETENKLMKLSKEIGSRNENLISKTGPNLLREKDNQISVMKLRSSDHIESQKICDKAEKRASTSSKETDCSEGSSKFQRKKVRLYNLESAPLYDVPPIISSNDASFQENVPCKSNLPEPDKGNISENALRTKRKAESNGKKYCARRKRTKSSDQAELPTTGQPIQLFDDFPVSDEDFEVHALRDSHIRRKRKISETSSVVHEQNVTGDRKADVLLSTEEKKPAKKQRKAAVKAMKRTKEILDRKLEVARDISVYDIIEDIDDFEKNSASASKTLKRKLSKSDTDTHSSEVSWMKKRKSYLFESPKKNYSDWRKSLHKKKELPVKVVSDTSVKKASVRKNSRKRKKESNKSDSNIDAKSLGFSELENYYLTVEKNCNRSSHSVMKDFETDLCELAKENAAEKSLSEIDFDSNAEIDHSRKKFKYNYKISSTEKKKKSATASEVSNDAKKDLDPENQLNNELNYDVEVECDNNGNTNEHIASSTEHVEYSEEENAVECEEIQSKHTLEDVGEQLICGYPIDKLEAVTENKGKIMILQRFLKSVAEYSDKTKDSTKSSLQETVSSSDLYRPHLSCKSFSDGIEIAKFNEASENQIVHDNNLTKQYPYKDNADNLEEPDNSVNKNDQSPIMRKLSSSGGFDRTQCLSSYDQVPEKAPTMEPKAASDLSSHDQHLLAKMQSMIDALKTSIGPRPASDFIVDSSDHQHMKRSKSVDEKVRKKCLSNSEKSSSKQEKFSKRWKRQKKSTDIKNSSFSSLCSQFTSTSMIDALKDKKWLQEITSLLSQNARNLSRKMLATVQVCFAEFCYKMSTLRENLVKTAKIFELPLSQDEYKLKSFIKSCKIVRLEVEKSLIRMRSVGKEYFEAEERDYRRLRKKQIKANKKYFQSMQKIKQNSIARMEQKVLYKTNYFLKKLHMHIDSA